MDRIYTVIRKLILNCIDDSYLPENVIQGFQAGLSDNFISFIILSHDRQFMSGVVSYTDTTKINNLLESLTVQIDYWSDKQYASQTNAYRMHNYIRAFAQEYLDDFYPDFGIGEIENVRNLSDSEDKGKYLYRYTLRFNLFAQNIFEVEQLFIDKINPVIKLVE